LHIEVEHLEDRQDKLTVELDDQTFETYKRRATQIVQRGATIPGFRPGKAPYEIAKRYFGEEHILDHAVDLIVEELYPKILDEAQVTPSGPGRLENVQSYAPLTMIFVVPLIPEVELGDYHSIRIPYEPPEVAEKDVEAQLQQLRVSAAVAEPANRPAQEGDLVYFMFQETLTEPAEGEDPLIYPETAGQVVIGQEAPNQLVPFEGFSQSLVGLSEGEAKDIPYTFPQDSSPLAGKSAIAHVSIQAVKNLNLPELNDEFAQEMGDFPTLDELKQEIRKQQEEYALETYNDEYMDKVMAEIKSHATLQYPPQMLEDEKDYVRSSIEDELANQKMDLPTYLKLINKDITRFMDEDVSPVAHSRLENGLIMDKIAELEGMEITDEELDRIVASATTQANEPEFREMFRGKISQETFANSLAIDVASSLLTSRVTELLRSIASGEAGEQAASQEPAVSEAAPEVAEAEAVQSPAGEASEQTQPPEPPPPSDES
jgi:trigger factor